jgi:hypothetical protein
MLAKPQGTSEILSEWSYFVIKWHVQDKMNLGEMPATFRPGERAPDVHTGW